MGFAFSFSQRKGQALESNRYDSLESAILLNDASLSNYRQGLERLLTATDAIKSRSTNEAVNRFMIKLSHEISDISKIVELRSSCMFDAVYSGPDKRFDRFYMCSDAYEQMIDELNRLDYSLAEIKKPRGSASSMFPIRDKEEEVTMDKSELIDRRAECESMIAEVTPTLDALRSYTTGIDELRQSVRAEALEEESRLRRASL